MQPFMTIALLFSTLCPPVLDVLVLAHLSASHHPPGQTNMPISSLIPSVLFSILSLPISRPQAVPQPSASTSADPNTPA
jgi:hypothetical protein